MDPIRLIFSLNFLLAHCESADADVPTVSVKSFEDSRIFVKITAFLHIFKMLVMAIEHNCSLSALEFNFFAAVFTTKSEKA